MIIKNALVLHGNNFIPGEVHVQGDRFAGQAGGQTIDAAGLYAVPGLIDMHFHGCGGIEFTTADSAGIAQIARHQAHSGVTSICPATLTLPENQLTRTCRAAGEAIIPDDGAELVGIYLEGPFISQNKAGAQNPNYMLPPDAQLVRRLNAASGGIVKVVTFAPEIPGAIQAIGQLSGEFLCSLAHTEAGYADAKAAFDNGAGLVTHMFNAMNPFSGREPGVMGAAWESGAYAELICDGVHLHPATIEVAISLFGPEKIVFVSDSMEAAGLGDGEYAIGGLPVTVRGNEARLQSGQIAGSVTGLMGCVRKAVEIGIPLENALRFAGENPAKALGIWDQKGSIAPGKIADMLLLDSQLNIVAVILRGKIIKGWANE